MKKGMGLVTGVLGAGVISVVIYTVMSGAGQEIYRSLTEGPPGVRPSDPVEDAKDPLAPDGAIGKLLPAESGVAQSLRDRQERIDKSNAYRAQAGHRAARPQGKDMAIQLGSVNLEDPSGRDIRVLISALKQARPDQRRDAAKALAVLGDASYLRPILTASAAAEQDGEYCAAAIAILAQLGTQAAQEAAHSLLNDKEQAMSGQCRTSLIAHQNEPITE